MKTYIKPEIEWEDMAIDSDILSLSDGETEATVGYGEYSKERESVNFSDEESIW